METPKNERLICHHCWRIGQRDSSCLCVKRLEAAYNAAMKEVLGNRRFGLAKSLAVALARRDGLPAGMTAVNCADVILADLAESAPDTETETNDANPG